MSFGRPPSFNSLTNVVLAPPEYGSFPLDHDGECKDAMKAYMACLRAHRNDNGACRALSRAYLECRMNKGLMEKHDLADLGFRDISPSSSESAPASASKTYHATAPPTTPSSSSSASNQRLV